MFLKERQFLGSELNMWMLSSDATWVDKLATWWRRNQRASLLSPDSSEIVKVVAAYGESRVSVSALLSVLWYVNWYEMTGMGDMALFFFFNMNSLDGCRLSLTISWLLTCPVHVMLIFIFAEVLMRVIEYFGLTVLFVTCAFCLHDNWLKVCDTNTIFEGI